MPKIINNKTIVINIAIGLAKFIVNPMPNLFSINILGSSLLK